MELTQLDQIWPVVLLSFSFKLIMAGIGYYFIRLILKHMDKFLDFDFEGWLNTADDTGKGIYLGMRILSICIFVAWIVS
jgi:hypothetical protein